MKARPLTTNSRPGGRPRSRRAKPNAFAVWLESCDRSAAELSEELKIAPSSLYSLRNGYFAPGRALAVKIEQLTTPRDKRGRPTGPSAVPVSSWPMPRR